MTASSLARFVPAFALLVFGTVLGGAWLSQGHPPPPVFPPQQPAPPHQPPPPPRNDCASCNDSCSDMCSGVDCCDAIECASCDLDCLSGFCTSARAPGLLVLLLPLAILDAWRRRRSAEAPLTS